MAAPLDALRAARDALVEHPDPAILTVVSAIDLWLAEGGDFAGALGLGATWHSALRMRERDAALGALAQQHYPDLTGRALARALVAAGRQYKTCCWSMNADRPDGRNGLLHDIAARGGMPSEGHLRRIFAGSFAPSQCASRALITT